MKPHEPPSWQVLENVIAALERMTGKSSGWAITQNAMVRQRGSDRRRQVDVFAECPSGPRTFRVGIDVKEESTPLDIETVEQLCAKAGKLDIDRYVIVSTSGFTEQAREEAVRHRVSAVQLTELEAADIFLFDTIVVPRVDIHYIELVYGDEGDYPSLASLQDVWLEDAEKASRLAQVAFHCAAEFFTANRDLEPSEPRVLEVVDEPQRWLRLCNREGEWLAPRAIRILWSHQLDYVKGRRFKTHEGHELFTAIVPHDGAPHQVTFTIVPNADGTKNLMVSLGALRPPRKRV